MAMNSQSCILECFIKIYLDFNFFDRDYKVKKIKLCSLFRLKFTPEKGNTIVHWYLIAYFFQGKQVSRKKFHLSRGKWNRVRPRWAGPLNKSVAAVLGAEPEEAADWCGSPASRSMASSKRHFEGIQVYQFHICISHEKELSL